MVLEFRDLWFLISFTRLLYIANWRGSEGGTVSLFWITLISEFNLDKVLFADESEIFASLISDASNVSSKAINGSPIWTRSPSLWKISLITEL